MLFLCNPFITSGQALIAGTGTFTVLGREALFNTSVLKVSEAGSFALSGQAADFRRNLIFEAAAGAIALDGQIVTMIYGKGLLAEVGAFTLTGNEAAVLRALLLEAGTGSFTVTGEDADFVRHLALAAEPGLFSLSGQTAGFRAGVNLGAEAGLFTLSGQEASIARGAVLRAAAGAYALNGQGVTLRRALRIAASMGSFAMTGQGAGFLTRRYSYRGRFEFDTSGKPRTFSAINIGDPAADRLVAVVVSTTNSSTGNNPSLTIGGVSATRHAFVMGGDGSNSHTSIFSLAVPSGTTADIVFNSSFNISGVAIAVYALYGLNSHAPVSIATSKANPLALNQNVLTGDIIIAGQHNQFANQVWSGLTQDGAGNCGWYCSNASAQASAAESPRSITCSFSGTANTQTGVVVVWR